MAIRYNNNEELVAMKEDVASRGFNIKLKKAAVVGLTMLAAGAVAAFAFSMAPMTAVMIGFASGTLVGGKLAEFFTMKDQAKLEIDENMVQSYNAGKNNWGAGFREEVLEHGYMTGAPNPGNLPRAVEQERSK